MKLRGLVPIFNIHVSGIDLYIPTISLIWNLDFPVLRKRTLCSNAGAERRAVNYRQAVEPRVHIYGQQANSNLENYVL